jgi:cyclohexyl-isocyanide hydratase
MNIAFVIYNGMAALDFIGVYDPVTRLKTMGFVPDLEWDICAYTREVRDSTGLLFNPTKVKEPLEGYDIVFVPGGRGSRALMDDGRFIQWLRTASGIKVSVCTGSLLLGSAGFLEGKKATTHRGSFDELKRFCSEVVDRRVVDEGDVITAEGVTSSIDLGLYLCEKLAGREARERIRRQMEYGGYQDE